MGSGWAKHLRVPAWSLLALMAAACAANDRSVQAQVVRQRAAFDWQCPPESLRVMHAGEDLFAVRGCGRRQVYDADGRCSEVANCTALPQGAPMPDSASAPPRPTSEP